LHLRLLGSLLVESIGVSVNRHIYPAFYLSVEQAEGPGLSPIYCGSSLVRAKASPISAAMRGPVRKSCGSFQPGGRGKELPAFHADPAFQEFRRSEDADKLIENVDETYMRPTDYSQMK